MVYPSTPLDNLKADLTVIAYYSDNTGNTLNAADYTLSGVLNAGLSVVTVIYEGRTTAFTLTISDPAHTHQWGEWIQTKAPTETEDGEETRTCALDPSHKETRYITALGHTHVWGNWVITIAPTCTEDGEETKTCSINNSHKERQPIDALGHNYGEWTQTTAPTCTEAGVETRTCAHDSLHKETQPIDALGHNYGEWTQTTTPTCTEEGEETRTCAHDSSHKETRTGAAALEHNYGEWTQTTAPTCTEEGEETRTCAHDSSHKETKPGANAIGHNWGEWILTTAPTQTASGIETRTCSHNATHKETRVVPATGDPSHTHIWSTWTPVTMPTCTEPGINKRTCALDSSHIETNPLEPIGHAYGEWIQTTAPTCTTSGVDTKTCSHNATHKETRAGAAALGHNYGNWTQTTAPTCTTAGVQTRTCAHDAAHKETQPIDALGHNWSNWVVTTAPTCTTAGMETKTCAHDAAHKETRSVAALGHNWGNWMQTTAPTCTTAGVETRTCAHDASHKETRTGVAALGHDYQNWTQTTAPTCTTAGVETGTCIRDQATTTRSVAALGHNWGNWTQTTAPTVTENGEETRTCAHDSSHKETRAVYATGTAGLAFELINGNTAYRVSKGTVSSSTVHIPAYHRPNTNSPYLPVTEIGNGTDSENSGAFGGSDSNPNTTITSITFAANSQLTTISDYAFSNCRSLTSITIPASVTSIGYHAFRGWTNAQTIYIEGYASESVVDSAWGSSWRDTCNAKIFYNASRNTGAAVAVPTLNSKTATSVTLNAITSTSTGQTVEYARNNSNTAPSTGWQSGTSFTGLTAATTYYFFARAAENANYYAGASSDGLLVTTKNAGATVAAPTAASKTTTSVTLNTVTASTYQTVEYARNNSNTAPSTGWQTDRNFTGLTAATTYYFFARAIENANYYAGAASAGTAITTNKSNGLRVNPPTLNSKTATSVTLNVITTEYLIVDGQYLPLPDGVEVEYAKSNSYSNTAPSTGWQTSTTFTGLTVNTTYYFFARTAENAVYYAGTASAGTEIDTDKYTGAIVAAPTTASITGNSVTLNTITSTSTGQTVEYSRSQSGSTTSNDTWQTSRTFTGLTPATTYYFFARAIENANYYAGAASAGLSVTTDKGTGAAVSVSQVLKTKTTTSITLDQLTPSTGQAVEYAINSVNTAPSTGWQIGTGGSNTMTFTGLTPATTYYFFARAAENAAYYAGAVSSRAITTDSLAIPLEMVLVPDGSFQMGKDLGTAATSDVTPVHTVTLTGFYMGKYEVTQAQYKAVMGSVLEGTSGTYGFGNNFPVYYVSWYEALVFCNKLSMEEGLTPAYRIGGSTDPSAWGTVPTGSNSTWEAVEVVSGSTGYRLPTEAQWEYAAKGGNGSPGNYTYAGSNNPDDVAWYYRNSGNGIDEVGTKAPNGLGLYDMSGNVSEWCWDWYGDYSSGAQTNPTGPSSSSSSLPYPYRVRRGGDFSSLAEGIRSVYRGYVIPNYQLNDMGFRLVRPVQ